MDREADLPPASPTNSSPSSSDLDTESTGSFFHDRSTSLGMLMGVTLPQIAAAQPVALLPHGGAASDVDKPRQRPRRRIKRLGRKWWKLCRGKDMGRSSLADFLRLERRLGGSAAGGSSVAHFFYGGAAEHEAVGGDPLFHDGRVLPPLGNTQRGENAGSLMRLPVSLTGICCGGAGIALSRNLQLKVMRLPGNPLAMAAARRKLPSAAECVICVGCTRWIWKRCTYVGSYDSETWPEADPAEFAAVPRICRLILAVYETDLTNPQFVPPGGFQIDPANVVKRVTYQETGGRSPPYLIYTDHAAGEIVLAVRGLNLKRESDYAVLLNNSLGMQMFDGGFVHHGLLKSAIWLLKRESETLAELWKRYGGKYKMIFAGHSLGSGVAALMSVLVANHGKEIGGIPRSKLRCYALAPARCMSLNLAVKYADVIQSIILQDDFLPRTATPLEDIFKSVFCLPCLLFWVCLRDTFIPEGRKLRDPRRLYAPGRMFHIVERKFCRCGRFPPSVRTAIPVEGRFEHIVLSCNATSDHGLLWIEKESQKALESMKEEIAKTPPTRQRMDRKESFAEEHKAALERAVTLNIPHAVVPSEEEDGGGEETAAPARGKPNWDLLVEKLFDKSPSRGLVLKKDVCSGESAP